MIKINLAGAVLMAITISGCASTTRTQMDVADLDRYQIDCSRKQEQLDWLQSQMPSAHERLVNGLNMTSMFGWFNAARNGTFTEDQALYSGQQTAIIRNLIYKLETQCLDVPMRPQDQSCIVLNENNPSGASNGAKCFIASQKHPITRWEPLVDD
jgi:hypothetical protein